jgi:excinuclease UvrABC nuclease subunit
MPINGDRYRFTEDNVANSPDSHGVYALFDGDELIYYGRAKGIGVTIRSRLSDHKDGTDGRCTQRATAYKREVTNRPKAREIELCEEYVRKNGRLPRCNEVMPS